MTDRVSSLLFMLIGGLMLWAAQSIPPPAYESLGSGFFPTILSALLIVFSLVTFVRSLSPAASEKRTGISVGAAVRGWMTPDNGRILVCALMTIVYVVVIKYTGFVATSIVFLLTIMVYLSKRTRKEVIYSVIVTASYVFAIYYTFVHLLSIFLP